MARASNAESRRIEPWHLFEVDPALALPLWKACVEFNARQKEFVVKINEGLRSTLRQAELRASGASPSARSKHQFGLAVDVAMFSSVGEYVVDLAPYRMFADEVRRQDLVFNGCHRITWGGSWKSVDGVHFEL